VNWDWTYGESFSDSTYLRGSATLDHLRRAGVYGVSLTTDESRGHYIGQIGAQYSNRPSGLRLLERALQLGPSDPLTADNVAWAYATSAATTAEQKDLAVALSLQAWAADPDDVNVIDTVACALNAQGLHRNAAADLEASALAHARFQKQRNSFAQNLHAIQASALCPYSQ
jgi:hypothetical protein